MKHLSFLCAAIALNSCNATQMDIFEDNVPQVAAVAADYVLREQPKFVREVAGDLVSDITANLIRRAIASDPVTENERSDAIVVAEKTNQERIERAEEHRTKENTKGTVIIVPTDDDDAVLVDADTGDVLGRTKVRIEPPADEVTVVEANDAEPEAPVAPEEPGEPFTLEVEDAEGNTQDYTAIYAG